MPSTLRFLARSLEFRLLLPLAAVIAAVLAFHALLGYWSDREEIARFVRADLDRSSSLIESASKDGMLLNRMEDVQAQLERLGASPGFAGIRIYGKDGRIALASDRPQRGRMLPITDRACVPCHAAGQESGPAVLRGASLTVREGEHELQRSLSILRNEPSCSIMGCHPSPEVQPVLGVLDVEMSMAPFDEAVARSRRELIRTTALLILASGLIVALFIRRLVHEPVARLHEGTRRIAAGDLSTRINVPGRHDLAVLAGAFNRMVDDLRAARTELEQWSRTLEQKIEEKTNALRQVHQRMTQVETMASLGKLSATVAHELNNPMSGILTYSRLVRRELAEQPLEAPARAELDSSLALIEKEAVRCGEIVKNLLAFARRRAVHPAETDLHQIVEHSLMLVRHHLEMRGIRAEVRRLAHDAHVLADPGQIQQAVLAVLMNAIEAMADTGRPGVLTVELAGDHEDVRLRIADTGVGIPPELVPHIFEPFVTTKGDSSGVGLGLCVVYGVVQSHGGAISVDSTPGSGTSFTITLPRRRGPAPEQEPAPAIAEASP